MQTTKKSRQLNQQGFVSIIVAMILIALISLITLGFAFLARQNQRENLNRQLSTQAFYAAESGVNDAIKKLPTLTSDVTSCNDIGRISSTPALGDNISYTCVLVNKQPSDLVYDSISKDQSTVARVTTVGGKQVANLKISWQDASGTPGFAAPASSLQLPNKPTFTGQVSGSVFDGYNITTATFPQYTGMLRTTIIPTSAVTSTNGEPDSLLNQSQTIFLYPNEAALGVNNTVAFRSTAGSQSGEGVFGRGDCKTNRQPRYCNTIVQGVGLSDFYIRLKAIYKPVAVTISATDSDGNPVQLSGAQAVVDVTGKAQDVVRRIQVRVPLSTSSSAYFPESAIETANTICKRFAAYSGGAEVLAPLSSTLYSGSNPPNNRTKDQAACQLPNAPMPVF